MLRDFARLSSGPFDLLIIGGGICGLMAAYDAAGRGLRVALVEKNDFGAGSSFNNLRTLHGGLRSLQSADLFRARESIVERRAMARIAPHLVTPQPFLIATRRSLMRGRMAFEAAFWLDRVIGRDRNAGVETALHLPRGQVVSRAVCLRLFPGVRAEGLTGGAMWYDYQIRTVERLNICVARAATTHHALLVNHAEAAEAIRSNDRVEGMRVRDLLTGAVAEAHATVTLNAAGAGSGGVMAAFGVSKNPPLLKAMNLVTSRRAGDVAVGAPTPDGRMLFMVPSRGRATFGTSHSSQLVGPAGAIVTSEDLSGFLTEINSAFPTLELRDDEVTLVQHGLVPATPRGSQAPGLRQAHEIRDHAREGIAGALSVVTVKYTTARRVAEEAVDRVVGQLQRPTKLSRTAVTELPGAEIADFEAIMRESLRQHDVSLDPTSQRHLIDTYGSQLRDVIRLIASRPDWAEPVSATVPTIGAEVIHAVRHEMACTLTDVVLRRTALGSAGYPGDEAALACATLMASEMGWDTARLDGEVDDLRRFYSPLRPVSVDRALRSPG